MTALSDSQLTTEANAIMGETTPGANTALRVGQMLIDIIDSKKNVAFSIPLANAATTAALPTNTRTSNVLTASANGAITSASLDGVAPFLGMRILVKNEATQANNGIYTLSQIGTGSTPWTMTRATDLDTTAEFVNGNPYPVQGGGTVNGGRTFILGIPGGFTINSSAVAFTVYQANGVFNVKDFLALGNGTTDDSTAIANTLAACVAAGGGDVLFPFGTYSTNNFNVSNATGVRVKGMGPYSSILKARQAGSIVTFTNCTGCYIEDIAIERKDSLFASSGGYSLAFSGCTRSGGSNIRISYAGAGILVSSCTEMHFRGQTLIERISAGGGAGFVRYEGTGAAPSNDCKFDRLVYDGAPFPVTPTFVKGAWTTSTAYVVGDMVIANDRFWICTTAGTSASSGTGPLTIPGTDGPTAYTTDVVDNTVHWKFLIGNSFGVNHDADSNDLRISHLKSTGAINNGVQMWFSSGTNNPSGLYIENAQISDALTHGIALFQGSKVWVKPDIQRTYSGQGINCQPTFSGNVEVVGGKVDSCWLDGIGIACGGVELNGPLVSNNSRKGSAQANGIVTGNNITNFRIVGGTRSTGANQASGLTIGTGCDNYIVVGNDFLANASSVVLNDQSSGTATRRKVRDNLGDDSDRATKRVTAQTTSLGATNIFANNPPKATYLVTIYLLRTTNGTGGTVLATIAYTDDVGTTSLATGTLALDSSGSGHLSATFVIRTNGLSQVTLATTVSGATGGPVYSATASLAEISDIAA